MKPRGHQQLCIVTHDFDLELPYQQVEGVNVGRSTLHCGCAVWITGELRAFRRRRVVSAYVEGLGVVHIDPKHLKGARRFRV
jgi:hypothetical protein